MKIYICNDTSSGHAGSQAAMISLRYRLRHHNIIATHKVHEMFYDLKKIEECDAVVVNGEGTIHHNAPAGNFLMEILDKGQELGKKTYLVNSVFQQSPPYYEKVLKNLTFFSVREPLSQINAQLCGGNPIVLLDSCADRIFRDRREAVRDLPCTVKGTTHPGSITHGVLDNLNYDSFLLNHAFEDIIAMLKTTSLYITGQHHGVYAAGLAGIPFIPLSGNSHKIESLIQWSGVPIKICKTLEDILEQIIYAKNNRKIYKDFHDFLCSKDIFDESRI